MSGSEGGGEPQPPPPLADAMEDSVEVAAAAAPPDARDSTLQVTGLVRPVGGPSADDTAPSTVERTACGHVDVDWRCGSVVRV